MAAEPALHSLAERHVVVLEPGTARIVMAHPFAAHRDGTRVSAGGREWWGNCGWDALGIVEALGLNDAEIAEGDLTLTVRDGAVAGDAVFHVAVPAARWWDDIAFT